MAETAPRAVRAAPAPGLHGGRVDAASEGAGKGARAAGFSAHLGKPMSVERLNAVVRDLLPRKD